MYEFNFNFNFNYNLIFIIFVIVIIIIKNNNSYFIKNTFQNIIYRCQPNYSELITFDNNFEIDNKSQ